MALSDVRARDAALSCIAPGVLRTIPAALRGTRFAHTAEVLEGLVESLESLKSGLLAVAETGNLYSVNVLFRVYLEHILKALAVFSRASHDGSDDFADRYIQLRVTEAWRYLRAYQAAGFDSSVNSPSILGPWFDEARPLTGGQVREMTEPFEHRQLIQMILDLNGLPMQGFLSQVIPNYSELSGFVHGGPTTFLILGCITNQDELHARIEHIANLTVSMFSSARRWLLELAAAMRPEYRQPLEELEQAMQAMP